MVLSSSIREQVAELLATGRKILAVKLVREKAGVTLLEAKTIVEELAQEPDVQLRVTAARPAGGPQSAGSGCLFVLLFLLGFTGTGVGLLSGAAVFYAGQQELIARGQRTQGTVVELPIAGGAMPPCTNTSWTAGCIGIIPTRPPARPA